MPSHRILVVEDESSWIELLKVWFQMAGYTNVEYASTGFLALEMAVQNPPECVLMDLVLPDQSGLEVCQKIRAMPVLNRVPVVVFTQHRKEKILGLQSGADYFVSKSDKPHELLATLEAVFRRREKDEGVMQKGDLSLRAQDRQVRWKGELVATLTPKMFIMFHVLVERSPTPVSRPDLFRLTEGGREPTLSRALDVMLNRLKKLLPAHISNRIVNVKNFGYVFIESVAETTIPPTPRKNPPAKPA